MRAMKRTARPSSPRLRQKSTRGAHDIRVGGLPSLLHGRRETGLRRSDCGLAAGRIARASARPAQPPTSYGPSEAFLPRDRVYEGLASPVPPGRIRSRWAPIRCPRLDCRRCPTRSARPRSPFTRESPFRTSLTSRIGRPLRRRDPYARRRSSRGMGLASNIAEAPPETRTSRRLSRPRRSTSWSAASPAARLPSSGRG